MPFSYPLMLDLTGRLVVIVGGGAVAARKAAGLLAAGAGRVRIVSPAFHPDLPSGVEKVAERYVPSHLDGAVLVFAATNDHAVNDTVVRDAASRGILASRADADDALPGDFATPALFRRGAVTVTVSAGTPSLAATIRDGLSERFDDRWAQMAAILVTLRPRLVNHPSLTSDQRAAIFRSLATEPALAAAVEGEDAVIEWICDRHQLRSIG